MARKRYQHNPPGLRESAVERMRQGVNKSALAEELGVDRSTLYHWQRKAAQVGGKAAGAEDGGDPRDYRIRELEAKVSGLEGALGRAALESRFFKGALRRIEESRRKRAENGGPASMPKSAAGSDRKAD